MAKTLPAVAGTLVAASVPAPNRWRWGKSSYVIFFSTKNVILRNCASYTCGCLGKLCPVLASGGTSYSQDHLFSAINCRQILYHWTASYTKYLRWDGIIKHWWKLGSSQEELGHTFDLFYFWTWVWVLTFIKPSLTLKSSYLQRILRENFKRGKIPTTFYQKILHYFCIL